MKTIWKFPLDLIKEQAIGMPEGAKLLDVQVQDGSVCLWAFVDDSKPLSFHIIHIYGTGHAVHPVAELAHLGTVQLGSLVFHVFERI